MFNKCHRILSIVLAFIMIISCLTLFGCEKTEKPDNGNDDTKNNVTDDGKDNNEVKEDLYNGIIPEDTEYVIANGVTKRMIALSGKVKGNQARLAKFVKKAQNGEDITVAFVGGSITMGGSANETSYDLCYAALTTKYLKEQFPGANITHINLGLNSTGSYINVHRLEKELLVNDPDLVFVDFSVNDTENALVRNTASYESLIRKIWNHSSAPAVVTIAMTAETWTFQERHAPICKRYQIPMISYADAINDVLAKGYIKWSDISDDNIHPNVTGHGVLSELICAYLQSVIDNVDNINTEKESDFSKLYYSEKYINADILSPADINFTGGNGWIKKNPTGGKTYNGAWEVSSSDGSFNGVTPIKFTVKAKNIGLMFHKYKSEYASFDVYIDGVFECTVNPSASYNYRDASEIASFDTFGEHTVEIVPKATGGKSTIGICAILVS